MANGDDSDSGGASDRSPGGDAPDAPPIVPRGSDPSVENVWLRHQVPRRRGRPRWSTVLLVLVFLALLTLWVVVRPGG